MLRLDLQEISAVKNLQIRIANRISRKIGEKKFECSFLNFIYLFILKDNKKKNLKQKRRNLGFRRTLPRTKHSTIVVQKPLCPMAAKSSEMGLLMQKTCFIKRPEKEERELEGKVERGG